jgi:hypothetical protein
MNTICPSCKSAIAIEDINVSTDLALCRACGRTFRFSEIVDGGSASGADLNSPPPGAWFEPLPDGFCVGATTRSWMAVFFIPFTCAWSGMSMYGIYWKQIESGNFSFLESVFGLPFLIGTCFLVAGCVLMTAGKVTITQASDRLSIFTGVGWLGLTRNYSLSDFRSVREDFVTGLFSFSANRQGRTIALEGKRRITFGTLWSADRRYFVLGVLRSKLSGASHSSLGTMATPRFR